MWHFVILLCSTYDLISPTDILPGPFLILKFTSDLKYGENMIAKAIRELIGPFLDCLDF